MPKLYEYQCEKHGPWTDQHSTMRATYDCPSCAMEQNERYAQLYHREVVVTQLTLLSLDVTQTEVMMRTARQLAHMTASRGLATAQGWLEGWWYSAGNNHPDNNPAYHALRGVLGSV